MTTSSGIIRLRADNLIPRPWGGFALVAFKGLPPDAARRRIGESFEVSAFPDDAEARAHPSIALLGDGTERPLPELLRAHTDEILGEAVARRHGAALPLLPKFLDVTSLLSIQSHPAGSPECYVVLAADPGASIRIGFREPMDARTLIAWGRDGRAAQERLLECLDPAADIDALQTRLAAALADRSAGLGACDAAVAPFVSGARGRERCRPLLAEIFATYWRMLDVMHEIPVRPGQVIFNATPERLRPGGVCSAEVHALGNPEGREILMLEIRRPGPTYRIWDHGRFPLRPLQIEEAVGALNLDASRPDDFVAADLADSPAGAVRPLVHCPDFVVEHLRVESSRPVAHDTRGRPVTLHVIDGAVTLRAGGEDTVVSRGHSVLVPAASAGYELVGESGTAADVIAARVHVGDSAP